MTRLRERAVIQATPRDVWAALQTLRYTVELALAAVEQVEEMFEDYKPDNQGDKGDNR
jgi:hypothetical protein